MSMRPAPVHLRAPRGLKFLDLGRGCFRGAWRALGRRVWVRGRSSPRSGCRHSQRFLRRWAQAEGPPAGPIRTCPRCVPESCGAHAGRRPTPSVLTQHPPVPAEPPARHVSTDAALRLAVAEVQTVSPCFTHGSRRLLDFISSGPTAGARDGQILLVCSSGSQPGRAGAPRRWTRDKGQGLDRASPRSRAQGRAGRGGSPLCTAPHGRRGSGRRDFLQLFVQLEQAGGRLAVGPAGDTLSKVAVTSTLMSSGSRRVLLGSYAWAPPRCSLEGTLWAQ